ncbi:MAG: hydroxymethylbilane synthase [Saezia sp.]
MNATHKLPNPLLIATRESQLALTQTKHIAAVMNERFGCHVELLGMTTQGDQILDRSLSLIGGKGVFIKELEQAMLEGRAHLAVHSLKDVPMELPQGFVLAAIPEREDARDAFVSNRYQSLEELPLNATVGTSSLRRQVMLKALRPDVKIEVLRGNINTRLKKLDEGQYDAIILAAAGLNRVQLQHRITSHFSVEQMLPAAGQGALGLEIHESQAELIHTIGQLSHIPTLLACKAERAVSRTLGGSCSVPLAAHAVWINATTLHLRAAWGDLCGKQPLLQAEAQISLEQNASEATIRKAQELGQQVAQKLADQGAIIACTAS